MNWESGYGAQNKMINPFHILLKKLNNALEAGIRLDGACHQNKWITLDWTLRASH